MATLIVPNEALENWLISLIANAPTLADCRLRLIQSAIPIDRYTTAAALVAAEADYTGYAPVPLGGWSDPIIDDDEAITEADSVSFTGGATADQNVFGCFCTLNGDDTLLGAASFGGAVQIIEDTELQIVCTFDLRNLLPE